MFPCRIFSVRSDLRNDISQTSFETAKESAAASLESFTDIGIVKVLAIAIEEATLSRMVKIRVREYGCARTIAS